MKYLKYTSTAAAGLALQMLLAPSSLVAEENEDVYELSPFVVDASSDRGYVGVKSIGATRTNVSLKDLPMAMNIVTKEFIEDTVANDLHDVVLYSSNVKSGITGGSFDGDNSNFSIRGLPTSYTVRNGVRRLRFVDTATVDRVEVIKGPASLLYGQIEPGGVVNYLTKRPFSEKGGSVDFRFGSDDLKRVQFDVNNPLGEKVGFRVSGAFGEEGTSYADELIAKNVVNPVFAFYPSENSTFILEYEFSEKNVNGIRGNQPFIPGVGLYTDLPLFFNIRNADDYYDEQLTVFGGEFLHRFNDNWNTRIALSNTEREKENRVTGSGYIWDSVSMVSRRVDLVMDQNDELFAQWDLNYKGQLSEGISLSTLVGAEYSAWNATGGAWRQNNPSASLLDWENWDRSPGPSFPDDYFSRYSYDVPTYNKSAYTVNQLEMMGGRLNALLGLRYDEYETRPAGGTTTGDSQTSPQAGVIFDASETTSIFLSYSESFLPQGGSRTDPFGDTFLPSPQVGEGLDLGIKYQSPDGNWWATFSLFDIQRTNILQFVSATDSNGNVIFDDDGNALQGWAQSGVEESKGFEVDVTAVLGNGVSLIFAYANADPKLKDNPQNPSLEGLRRADVAKNQGSLWIKKEFSDGNLAGFSFGGGIRYVGERPMEQTVNTLHHDAYTVSDLSFAYDPNPEEKGLSFRLKVNNIFDEIHFRDAFTYGRERNFIFSTEWEF
ncbi:TonB-dependent siderophore receptor [Pelagicoccus mobilis]|uniref:TonB-dependent receptor n=1 Tax=Pelagicoccus mobilis TaxID=415221 RepID=A0A934VQ19_9BACT|nr:TonB-dependent receptor [Pelagicoccus mobilis]MBK1876113.1 TonB-dependent receptor [Pelagicoccus mobilis]